MTVLRGTRGWRVRLWESWLVFAIGANNRGEQPDKPVVSADGLKET